VRDLTRKSRDSLNGAGKGGRTKVVEIVVGQRSLIPGKLNRAGNQGAFEKNNPNSTAWGRKGQGCSNHLFLSPGGVHEKRKKDIRGGFRLGWGPFALGAVTKGAGSYGHKKAPESKGGLSCRWSGL